MKNWPTGPEDRGSTECVECSGVGTADTPEHSLPPAWTAALSGFDRSLRARGMAEKTRRAYGVDLGQVAAILDSIPQSTPLQVRDRAMFELAYAAGLRAEEIVNLDLADLDPDAEELRVSGKGGRTRIVPAGGAAWGAIERYVGG